MGKDNPEASLRPISSSAMGQVRMGPAKGWETEAEAPYPENLGREARRGGAGNLSRRSHWSGKSSGLPAGGALSGGAWSGRTGGFYMKANSTSIKTIDLNSQQKEIFVDRLGSRK